ncbi:DNA mismatch repair protein MutS [Oharaeibacter diazotrophicus]|uniref:DNA mismatch repair protein MutS n=2 Tax=Oharaeibacter diazotrophicus TaxID=1920512 RepID=A0A4R6R8Q3_9HYPH|nr:DNA mismatch repair protein MutS [Oharaeibacter diazotrophicus]TDP82339.1 DNA mismatch repair protein MutS [Oharaeibacter diazotrophicus]BBE72898.1 DNA mismatch repair protein MutS [Pleomorphomonas sp. SM30]GLS76936.1 DNA mismatch repair protein MutS [Oharaeibacter diazotrophicus]
MNEIAPIEESAGEAGYVTPVMAQYVEIKAANPDCLLFYRMGDFYELFFEDAETASRALGITLTKRGKHLGQDIPMAGVPVHAADDYLQRLIALGHRVAVCEQLEDPAEARKRGSKAVVRRDVVRLVTPGTLTEETLLDARRSNFLAAVARQRGSEGATDRFALAWIDMSTGAFRLAETAAAGLPALLARVEPKELLVPDNLFDEDELRRTWKASGAAVAPVPRAFFDGATAHDRLAAYYGVRALDGFGAFSRLELSAAAAVVAYVEKTQVGGRPPLDPPARDAEGGVMAIDAATRANLELVRTLSGERRGSLLAAVDRTVTGAGARLLAERIAAPLTDTAAIRDRLDTIDLLVAETGLRTTLRSALARAPDMARAFTRLSLDRGGPRDLAAIAAGLEVADRLAAALAPHGHGGVEIAAIVDGLAGAPHALGERIADALADELPLLKRDGGFVRGGFRADLDEARALREDSRQVIAALQATYAETTEIRALKIRHNGVLGYFVEVPPAHGPAMMSDPLARTFIHRQTLANCVRFSTTELGQLEGRIASAAERALAIELSVFSDLLAAVVEAGEGIKVAAATLATLDVAAALAELADAEGWVRPRVDDSLAFDVEAGRHPVVEQVLKEEGASFVANDARLGGEDAGRLWLVTGPNMAGKSTFLRQNALIAVLAQAGCFVPARQARIGVVDRLFSRVGAADDLARGRSTFMVEMIETAAILNQAGPRAFVVLDEIGRGTATFDGLSIAWATIEHLHEVNRARALFATHYHELTALAERLPRIVNATVKVKEWKGDVVFLHEIVPGAADRSYGIQVAKLAGLPPAVVERARAVLAELERTDGGKAAAILDDLPLFSAARRRAPAPAAAPDPAETELLAALDALAPDDLTPREAIDALYRLKSLRARARRD